VRLISRVVAGGGDLAHRTGQVVAAERGEELPGPELGGFNWLSQHLDGGGVDGQASGLDEGVDGPFADEVAGRSWISSGH